MEFLWQEIAIDPRIRVPAGRRSGPLSRPTTFAPTLRGQEQHFRPAGRVDRTPSLMTAGSVEVANPGTGQAFAAAVQYDLAMVNEWSLTTAIDREFRRFTRMVQEIMLQHHDGGLLAVAAILVHWDPAQAFGVADPSGRPPAIYYGALVKRLGGLDVGTTVYAQPEHAYWQWQHTTARLEPGTAREGEYLDHTFFWGEWTR